jgi:hypothetical protein
MWIQLTLLNKLVSLGIENCFREVTTSAMAIICSLSNLTSLNLRDVTLPDLSVSYLSQLSDLSQLYPGSAYFDMNE